MLNKWIFTLIVCFTQVLSFAQDTIPKNYFRSPLGIPLFLAGNFGELRSNHFHSGLDMKTQGREGFNIYAAADGYISRIKISPWGYGTALYITHNNGYTTVYGHLQKLTGKIGEYVKTTQYKKESFEIELFPTKEELTVTKGDVVALSGNSSAN